MSEVRQARDRKLNPYEGKELIIVNIDHAVRFSIGGQAYIVHPADVGIRKGVRPILKQVKKAGYKLAGVSHQIDIKEYVFSPGLFIEGIRKMNQMLLPDSNFDGIYYSWDGEMKAYDTRIVFDAMRDARVYRKSVLYVGYTILEAKMCDRIGLSFIAAEDFFRRVVYRRIK